jgi:hypothetical protein
MSVDLHREVVRHVGCLTVEIGLLGGHLLFPMPSVLFLMLLVVFLVASSFESLMAADLYYLFTDIFCVCSLVQNLSSLLTSSLQAPYKLLTSSLQAPYMFYFETCI